MVTQRLRRRRLQRGLSQRNDLAAAASRALASRRPAPRCQDPSIPAGCGGGGGAWNAALDERKFAGIADAKGATALFRLLEHVLQGKMGNSSENPRVPSLTPVQSPDKGLCCVRIGLVPE